MKLIKNLTFVLLSFLLTQNALGQSAVADLKFEDAEIAYNNKNYSAVIKELDEFDKIMGGIKSKSLYLRIVSQNKLLDTLSLYETESNFIQLNNLKKNVSAYLKTMESEGLDDKYREIYKINTTLGDYPADKQQWVVIKQRKDKEKQVYWAAFLAMSKESIVTIEGGSYMMGSDEGKGGRKVKINSFKLAKYEVTEEQWEKVMGPIKNEYHKKGGQYPVSYVSWDNVQEFLIKLNKLTDLNFRLPTEAEWEYAACGGNKSMGYKYIGSNDIDAVAWYKSNSGNNKHPVGQKTANELGIYDMAGNVSEWCSDWYDDKHYYESGESDNPQGPKDPSNGKYYENDKVVRGGDYMRKDNSSKVNYRSHWKKDILPHFTGFRLALSL